MSDVVIRSTENGPNLVIVDGKVVQLVSVRWVHADAFLRWDAQEKRVHGQNARGQSPLRRATVEDHDR